MSEQPTALTRAVALPFELGLSAVMKPTKMLALSLYAKAQLTHDDFSL
jgi:hypothetical protein